MSDEHTAAPGAGDPRSGSRIPASPSTPPPGGPADPAQRTVTPVAHPTVVLDPNPPLPEWRRIGWGDVVIGIAGVVTLVSTWLSWGSTDFGTTPSAWGAGTWPAGVLGFVAAAFHLVRLLPPADKAVGALLPLLLCTAAVWIPIASIPGNGNAWGIWTCLVAGLVLTGFLLAAAMIDPALRRADDPDDLFN